MPYHQPFGKSVFLVVMKIRSTHQYLPIGCLLTILAALLWYGYLVSKSKDAPIKTISAEDSIDLPGSPLPLNEAADNRQTEEIIQPQNPTPPPYNAPRRTVPEFYLHSLDHSALLTAAEKYNKKHPGRFRFAETRAVHLRPSTHGQWVALGGGRSRWELDIRSEGAHSLNLAFDRFRLPTGATLRLSGRGGRTAFAFTDQDEDAHGQLWTPLILGDSASLRLEIDDALAAEAEIVVTKINHGFRGPRLKSPQESNHKIGNNRSQDCQIDVICTTANDADFGPYVDLYRDQIRSVGTYTLNGRDTCSGALINNTAEDQTPYFLTAAHCGITPENAASIVLYWNFENSTCREIGSDANKAIGDGPLTQFNSGAIFRAEEEIVDFALIELDDPVNPGYKGFFAGWDRSGRNPAFSTGIHHPAIAEKRISFELDPTTTTQYLRDTIDNLGTHIRVSGWDYGVTEGGSSGSPLFDETGHIIGFLTGGDSSCGVDDADWYGRVSVAWDRGRNRSFRLSDWLDPLELAPTTLEGIHVDQLLSIQSTTLPEGESGNRMHPVTVTLSPATEETVRVRIRTGADADALNPATSGVDFLPIDTTLIFQPNQTEQTIDLTLIGDATPEEHENIFLFLSEASRAFASSQPVRIVILNDDYTTPTITSTLSTEHSSATQFNYRITALGTPTAYELTNAPEGMTVDARTGEINWQLPHVGDYNIQITARNPAGASTETLRLQIKENPLFAALELPETIQLDANGPNPWRSQTIVTHDGIDAAQSAAIRDLDFSTFSLHVTGPDVLNFYWKVSSEADYDLLTLEMDNSAIQSISGNTAWAKVSLPVPEGSHKIKWVYSKDESIFSDQDAGWVDQITLDSILGKPSLVGPTEAHAFTGENTSIEIVPISPNTHVTVSGLPAGLAYVDNRHITGIPQQPGRYTITFTAENNGQSDTHTINLAILDPIGPALEQPNRKWESRGHSYWFSQSVETYNSASAAQAQAIGDDQYVSFFTNVTGPDVLIFWWKTSSEFLDDVLFFTVDGVDQDQISGLTDWQRILYRIPSGEHRLEWAYAKDPGNSVGLDTAWVDRVAFASDSPKPFITSAVSTVSFDGIPYRHQITAENEPIRFGAENLPSGLQIDPQTGIISGQVTSTGKQDFFLWAENTSGRSRQAFTIERPALRVDLATAIEQPNLPVSSASAIPWQVSTTKMDAVSQNSAHNGVVDNNQSSRMSAWVAGPGKVDFRWFVSSEWNSDYLQFFIDGKIIIWKADQMRDWKRVESINLSAGLHRLDWVFVKDDYNYPMLDDDTGWIDDLRLFGYSKYIHDAGIRLGQATPLADPDGDQYENILEFVFATDPDDAHSIPQVGIAKNGEDFTVTFPGSSNLGTVRLQLIQSADLNGNWSDSGITPQITPAENGHSLYRFNIPRKTAEKVKFFRIRILLEE